jgi:hypothetical protein
MRETIEFRIPEDSAKRVLGPQDGIRLGFGGRVRKIELPLSDPRVAKIGEAERRYASKGRAFFTWSKIYRRYTKQELEAAKAFLLEVKHAFEPVGEQCGTIYDESEACRCCGVGWQQKSDLILDARKLPKRGNLAFAQTIVPEVIVSAKLVQLFQSHRLRGAEFRAVRDKRKPHIPVADWYQPLIYSTPLTIVPPTRTGNGPFDDDPEGEYRCPRGHVIGLNVLSELYVRGEDFDDWDIAYTKQYVGCRGGVVRPEQLLVISPKLWRLLTEHGLKGFSVEVVHLE